MHEPHMSVVVTCALHCFSAQATISVLCCSFLEGEPPLPDQLPGEHTGLQSQAGSASFYRSAL